MEFFQSIREEIHITGECPKMALNSCLCMTNPNNQFEKMKLKVHNFTSCAGLVEFHQGTKKEQQIKVSMMMTKTQDDDSDHYMTPCLKQVKLCVGKIWSK